MTARERLQELERDILRMMAGSGMSVSIEAPAALRELDQLLADCAHYFLGYGLEDQESKLYERLAQAGYGEK